LKATVGLGVALPLFRFAPLDTADAQGDATTTRPREGDRLVRAGPDGKREPLTLRGVPPGSPPIAAYPMDPTTGVVRDGSRLNQVLVIRLDPKDLSAETRVRAGEGIVAYSAVCTHTGCDQWDWQAASKTIKCPCHFSTFDVKDAARVLDGPAPRRLPALPLKVVDGVLRVAGSFVGRPGFQQGGG
jgi:Rieske Fe-S protein